MILGCMGKDCSSVTTDFLNGQLPTTIQAKLEWTLEQAQCHQNVRFLESGILDVRFW